MTPAIAFSSPFPAQSALPNRPRMAHHQSAMTAAPHHPTPMTTAARLAVAYGGIHHVGVLVRDTVASKRFYLDVLGMTDDDYLRPHLRMKFKGAFVRAGASQIHLMQLPSPDPHTGRPEHGGRDRHVAVSVRSIQPIIHSLTRHQKPFTTSSSGRVAIFTRDLDANTIEFFEDTALPLS